MIDFKANLQQASCNDVEVQTWTHNGVEVYSASKPFYWVKDGVVQDGMPTNYQTVSLNPNMTYLVQNSGIATFDLMGSPSANTNYTGKTATVATQGNKNLEIVVGTISGGALNKFVVGGVDCTAQAQKGVVNLDISNMTEVNIEIAAVAWAGGNHFLARITTIRFY